jgi:hypothetical protein
MSLAVPSEEPRTLEEWDATLLLATEHLHHGVVAEAPGVDLDAAHAARTACFEGLKRMIESGVEPGAEVRGTIAHVRALDAEILEFGARAIERVRAERHALGRRRAAIQVHARRERSTARAITVKA